VAYRTQSWGDLKDAPVHLVAEYYSAEVRVEHRTPYDSLPPPDFHLLGTEFALEIMMETSPGSRPEV
jgi:hypothetical protein